MNLSHVRIAVRIGCGLLLLLIWHFSQQPWSHYGETAILYDSDGYGTGHESKDYSYGYSYFFAGTSGLLLAAGWLILGRKDDRQLANLISLGSVIYVAIAFGCWYREMAGHPDSVTTRQTSRGYSSDDAAEYVFFLTIAMAVLSVVPLFLGGSQADAKPSTPELTDESGRSRES